MRLTETELQSIEDKANQLADLRSRATSGPWASLEQDGQPIGLAYHVYSMSNTAKPVRICAVLNEILRDEPRNAYQWRYDRDFIAAARNLAIESDLFMLLDEVRRLRADLDSPAQTT